MLQLECDECRAGARPNDALEISTILQVYKGLRRTHTPDSGADLVMSPRIASRTPYLMAAAAILLLTCGHRAMAAAGQTGERQVQPVIARILSAWNHADARSIAAQYEAGGDFVSPDGVHAQGRRQIEAFYQEAFSRGYAGSRAAAEVAHVRHLTGSVALVDGTWKIQPTPTSKIRRPEAGLFFAVLQWHRGRWHIAALREQASAIRLRDLTS